jgi:hypothetical protein
MDDHDLIAQLCADVKPVPTRLSERELTSGLLVGSALSVAVLMLTLGIQSGLDTRAAATPFFMKLAYVASLLGLGFTTLRTLARPGTPTRLPWVWFAATAGVLLIIAASQISVMPLSRWAFMLLGASWRLCPIRVAALAVPIFAGLCWALRRQAPVRLRAAGAAAGFVAGAAAAAIYALACTENSAAFVLIWYSLGIALATGIGALLGTRLLRW